MKQNVIKLVLFICLSAILLGLLFLIAGQMPQPQKEEQTTGDTSLEQSIPSTEQTKETETVKPTESTGPVLQANPFAPSDFVRDGEWMTCSKQPCLLGVDVSKYQGQIDWEQVAASGIQFAIIRVGGRGYGQSGNLYADDMAQKNYTAAKAAGLQVGAYFFSQAISVEEAEAEATYVLEQIRNWELDLPVVFDWEYISETARTAHTDAKTVTACADAFCKRILAAGKKAMVYVRTEDSVLELETLAAYPRWVALHSDTMDFPYSFDFWQYTKTGKVSGIQGNVDINIWIPPKADA